MFDSMLTAGVLAATIMVLGGLYLFILRTPGSRSNVRYLMAMIAAIAVGLGLWAALLGRAVAPTIVAPANQPPAESPEQPPGATE
jgi:hypothetical protein